MDKLRTLVLTKSYNLSFIHALNPKKNIPKLMKCPELEDLILYVESLDRYHVRQLLVATRERASRGAKLKSVTIVGLNGRVSTEGVFSLGEYVKHVDDRVEDAPPDWNHLPREWADEVE